METEEIKNQNNGPNKIAHLQMIQGIIDKMGGNLFYLRGWSMTLLAGLFAISTSELLRVTKWAPLLFFILLILFWIYDAYFLSLERKFRGLYNKIRKTQEEKIDGSEEVIHLLDVANMIYRDLSHDSVLISAGLCHDLLEDTECSPEEIKEKCGEKVLKIVQAVTNDPLLEEKEKWEEKKEKYIQNVELGGIEAMLVSLVDKIVNLKALKESYAKKGSSVWEKFNRGKEKNFGSRREFMPC